MHKAVFLDRDGVNNELIYNPEQGLVDSPFTAQQFHLLPRVSEAIKTFHQKGFKIVVISNQPNIAKGYQTRAAFKQIRSKMAEELVGEGAFLDGEYYCFHHPQAKIKSLKVNCNCRKPKPGLLLKAAAELDIDMSHSWMVGDGLTDMQAGRDAGCRTVLIGRMRCELCQKMEDMEAHPDFIVSDLFESISKICQ